MLHAFNHRVALIDAHAESILFGMMKNILQTPVRNIIVHDSIKTLLFELYLLRNWSYQGLDPETRLFPAIQGIYEPPPGKRMKQIPLTCAVPEGLLRSHVGKVECPLLNAALAELGRIKGMPLEMYSNKAILTFLNHYFCQRSGRSYSWL